MTKENKTPVAGISNQEVLAEINLIAQIQQIEGRLAFQPDTVRFAQLADAYLNIGEFEHAILACQEGLKIYPHYDTATFVLAKAYYRMGDKKKARAILEELLTSHPAHLTVHKLLGDLALEEDDIVQSVSHYRIALRMDPINRPIIQSLVDLKEPYQKIKAAKPADEEEEQDIRPTILKKEIPKPASEKAPVKMETRDAFAGEITDSQEFKIEETKPVESKPVEKKTTQTEGTADVKPVHKPAYTDEKGLMYFYDDDEVSFEEYKQRQEWQKAGKALILSRETLDAKLTLVGAKTAEITKTAEKKPEIKKPPAEQKTPTTFEEHLEDAMLKEEEELLSEAEQDDGLARIDISYKDYLDLLTEEADLIEALFQDEEDSDEKEITAKPEPATEPEAGDNERSMPYQDYVENLTDESEINEANFIADFDERVLSLTEFSEYLEHSDDVMDVGAYALLSRNGDLGDLMKDVVPSDEGPPMTYRDYFSALTSDAERREAALEKAVEKSEKTESRITAKEPAAEKIEVKKIPEKTDVKQEETASPAFVEKKKSVERTSAVREEPIEKEVAFLEVDEINPQDATPEMVDELAARGQYGSAYKVCKMLKAKNPTDAKIDRKILELKRLYLWSSQLVG